MHQNLLFTYSTLQAAGKPQVLHYDDICLLKLSFFFLCKHSKLVKVFIYNKVFSIEASSFPFNFGIQAPWGLRISTEVLSAFHIQKTVSVTSPRNWSPLKKTNTLTLAHSVERRQGFLFPIFTEYMFSCQPEWKLTQLEYTKCQYLIWPFLSNFLNHNASSQHD